MPYVAREELLDKAFALKYGDKKLLCLESRYVVLMIIQGKRKIFLKVNLPAVEPMVRFLLRLIFPIRLRWRFHR